ncbi:hypothetical protein PACILC2_25030 [Paenibacillus cisolokensis]|mgnify:CR=1 FL=1|jgi:uncharacterized membrane protein SirB2|uniref:DUF2269 family protein n=1 Tax=Paenibacillus cisolokensis TaxID=1658519 RepID=A0ABQ4N6X4_9BACL|nr:DUF2269 family protein [Paenibacillus cisolokensis]GIQ63935.1 hypothetical protein PACILC2_25030 [Paenibacillus cisolokensis]
MYNYLLTLHIISAMTAIVAVAGYPLVMSGLRTTEQAKFGLTLLEKLAVLPKVGGTLLFLTGLAFGYQQTYLFRQLWYWLAIALFGVILIIMAALLPNGIKRQRALLHPIQGGTLPDAYRRSRRRSLQLEVIANVCVVMSILLMVFQPS